MRPQAVAWIYLIVFFSIFCALVASGVYMGWRYYSSATTSRASIVSVNAGSGTVGHRVKGGLRPDIPQTKLPGCDKVCFELREGESVTAYPEAGYGPAASVVLPDKTQVDLYGHPSGADLTLLTYRVSRWTSDRQDVVLQQNAGYARYDVQADQPYEAVSYVVQVGKNTTVRLDPGGSYSIDVLRGPDGTLRPRLVGTPPLLAEVAVRSGSATVHSSIRQVSIRPGEKVEVDTSGVPGEPAPAAWELVADGNFNQHTSDEYNQPKGTDTWSISSVPAQEMTPSEMNGYFSVSPKCPPVKGDVCDPQEDTPVAQFFRQGGQTKPFITGITQTLNVDVSEYTQSLRLSAWVRVQYQSLKSAGVASSECPITIRLIYKRTSPADQDEEYAACVYSGEEIAQRSLDIGYYDRVSTDAWSRLEIDLRADPRLKDVRYLRTIRIEARGHDYISEFTDVSLVGK